MLRIGQKIQKEPHSNDIGRFYEVVFKPDFNPTCYFECNIKDNNIEYITGHIIIIIRTGHRTVIKNIFDPDMLNHFPPSRNRS